MKMLEQWRLVLAACAILGCSDAAAQTSPSGGPAPPGAVGNLGSIRKTAADPIVAQINGQAIRESEVADEIHRLPGGGSPGAFTALYNVALRRLIDREALVVQARDGGYADDAVVVRRMQEASDQALEEAYLQKATSQLVTEAMLLQRYDSEVRGKPGPEEVHGWAILVPTEAQAADIIAKLAGGADFATLAKQSSKDVSAREGGDLGFVQQSTLAPLVGAVLFELRPGEVTPYPVRTPVGWFVLKVESRRTGPTPSFAEAHDRLEAEAQRAAVGQVLAAALQGTTVQAFDANGNPTAPPPAEDKP